jgi:hypothetical protein
VNGRAHKRQALAAAANAAPVTLRGDRTAPDVAQPFGVPSYAVEGNSGVFGSATPVPEATRFRAMFIGDRCDARRWIPMPASSQTRRSRRYK